MPSYLWSSDLSQEKTPWNWSRAWLGAPYSMEGPAPPTTGGGRGPRKAGPASEVASLSDCRVQPLATYREGTAISTQLSMVVWQLKKSQ